MFGKGTPGQAAIQLPVSEVEGVTSFIDIPAIPASEDYVQGLFGGGGLLKNIKSAGKKVASANTGIDSLKGYYESYLASKEERIPN